MSITLIQNQKSSNVTKILNKLIKNGLRESNTNHSKTINLINILGQNGFFNINNKNNDTYSLFEFTLLVTEIAKFNPSLAHLISIINYGICNLLQSHKNSPAIESLLSKISHGTYCAFAFHEQNDYTYGKPTTTLSTDGNNYILNGSKHLISYAKSSEFAMVYAFHELKNKTVLCIVPMKQEYIEECSELTTFKHIQIGNINFYNVRIKEEHIIENGLDNILNVMKYMRLLNTNISLGITERIIEETLEIINKRTLQLEAMSSVPTIKNNISLLLAKFYSMRAFIKDVSIQIENKSASSSDDLSIYLKIYIPKLAKQLVSEVIEYQGDQFFSSLELNQLFLDLNVLNVIGGSSNSLYKLL